MVLWESWMRVIFGVLLLIVGFSARAEVLNVSNAELEGLIASGVPVVDVRRADEWAATGVVPGSYKMTFFDKNGDYDAKKWLADLEGVVGKGEPFVLICQTGARSKVVGNWLANGLGFEGVYNVTDGISRWIGEGKAVFGE